MSPTSVAQPGSYAHMTKRIPLAFALLSGLLVAAPTAHAGQGTEQLLGAYNFLLEAGKRPTALPHGDFTTFRAI